MVAQRHGLLQQRVLGGLERRLGQREQEGALGRQVAAGAARHPRRLREAAHGLRTRSVSGAPSPQCTPPTPRTSPRCVCTSSSTGATPSQLAWKAAAAKPAADARCTSRHCALGVPHLPSAGREPPSGPRASGPPRGRSHQLLMTAWKALLSCCRISEPANMFTADLEPSGAS